MKHMKLPLLVAGILVLAPSMATAQIEANLDHQRAFSLNAAADVPPVPPVVERSARRRAGVVRPLVRTLAMVAASTGAYALADENWDSGTSDVAYGPIAAGAAATAVTGLVLSSGNPVRIVLGSALATLPAAALSTFLEGSLDEGEQGNLPLVAFGVPHGLLASGFAQDR